MALRNCQATWPEREKKKGIILISLSFQLRKAKQKLLESKQEVMCVLCRREATPIMQGKLIRQRFTFKFSDHNMDAGSPLLLPQLM